MKPDAFRHRYHVRTDGRSNVAWNATIRRRKKAAEAVPGAPTGLSASDTNASALLVWTAPSDPGGQPITDYVVQFRLASSDTFVTFTDGVSTDTNASVTGLTNGLAYVFRVAALSANGVGAYSETVTLTLLSDLERILALSPSLLIWPANGAGWQGTSGGTLAASGQPLGLGVDLAALGGKTQAEWLASAPVLFSETFDSDAGWTLPAETGISGGTLNFTAVTTTRLATRTQTLTQNVLYEVTYTVSNLSGNNVRVVLGNNDIGIQRSANGTYTEYIRNTTTNNNIGFQGFTGVTASIDNISVRELPGNHLRAGTWASPADSSRALYGRVPLGGRRNLLTYSEDVTNGVWTKFSTTTVATGYRETTANAEHYIDQSVSLSGDVTATFEIEVVGRDVVRLALGTSSGTYGVVYTVSTNTISSAGTAIIASSATDLGDGYRRITLTSNAGANRFRVVSVEGTSTMTFVGDVTKGANLRNLQLELGSTATAYQKVTDQYDVTEAGVADTFYIQPDAVNDSMEFLSALSARTIIAAVRVPTNYTTNDRFLTSNDEAINVSVNAGDWTNTGSGSTRINKASGATFTAGGAFQLLTIEYASSQAFTRLWFSATGSQFGSMDVAALAVFATPPSETDRNTVENILGGIIGL